MNRHPLPRRPLCAAILLFGALAILAPAVPAQPIPPGTARVWFFQDRDPYVSMNYATVRMNGVVAGSVPPYGAAIYRDVPPGHYQLTADSEGVDVNQSAEVDLASGQEVYVKVMNLPHWATPNLGSMQRDTYYLRQLPAAEARPQLAQTPG